MTNSQIADMQKVWASLGQAGQHALVERFYAHLFNRHPEMRASFGDISAQHGRFWSALDRVISSVGSMPDQTRNVLYHLGAAHVRYGVDPSQIALVRSIFEAELAALGATAVFTPLLDFVFAEFARGLMQEDDTARRPRLVKAADKPGVFKSWSTALWVLGLAALLAAGAWASGLIVVGLMLDR